jgi:transposase-like protein
MLGKPSKRLVKHLEENGTRANATVMEVAEKGMAVTSGAEGIVANTTVALKARLKVQPDDEPEFEVTQRFRFSQLAIPSAGMVVPVIYDPNDHDKLMIDESPEAQQQTALASAGVDPNQLGQMIQQAQQMQASAGQMPAQMPGMTPPAQQEADPVAQLEKLQALKEKGALTDAEFEAEKQKILGQ